VLSTGKRPNLVVFYIGYNEMALGLSGPMTDVAPGVPVQELSLSQADAWQTRLRQSGNSSSRPTPLGTPAQRYQGVVDAALRGLDLARALGKAYGFRVVAAWQPDIFSRRIVPGEAQVLRDLRFDAFLTRAWRGADQQIRRRLPPSIVDLGDAFDRLSSPVFYDTVHTDPAGAAAAAAALWAQFGSDVANRSTR
jgi:hypothetical protein